MHHHKDKIMPAQQRILNLLSDGKPHALIPELLERGFYNQTPAIKALVDKKLIEEATHAGYFSQWRLSDYYNDNKLVIDVAISRNISINKAATSLVERNTRLMESLDRACHAKP